MVDCRLAEEERRMKDGQEWIMRLTLDSKTMTANVERVGEVIRCKDCKYFELDHIEKVESIPLIVAHEICTRWGNGCKTSPDGYCFMAERRD